MGAYWWIIRFIVARQSQPPPTVTVLSPILQGTQKRPRYPGDLLKAFRPRNVIKGGVHINGVPIFIVIHGTGRTVVPARDRHHSCCQPFL